ncbi:MAG: MauE/DoxX family redox-associated membrane protein, partial [Gammaproteobacteria bacterium]
MPEIDPIIIAIAHYAVALLFLSSAYAKATNFAVFRATLAEYELLPPALAGLAAVVFTGAEFLIGSTALVAGTATAAMYAAACLLCLYALAIGINLARGRRDID